MLFNCLGSACYKPQRDWRSSMRTGLGYDEVDTSIGSETPFIIERNTDALSQFLFQQGYEPAGRWMRNSPGVRIYYIDVQTTPDSRPSPFTVTPDRMEKMRECHISRESEAPEKVYILVRLSDVHPRHPSVIPTAWFFINPWAYYTEGLMRAHFSNANETFSMKISRNAPPSFTMKSPECDLDDSTSSPDIVDRVARLFSSSKSRDQTRRPQDLRVAPSQTPYRYKSLRRADRIRLLALSPGKGATPLRGDLKVHRLQENSSPPEYACVSYVWGSSLRQFTLYTPEGMLMLTASLYLALLHLRDATKVVYIWADAICIDQEDSPGRRNEEKEHQIRMLPRIFQRAKTVFAWLGIEENGSRKVMRKFEDWGTKILQERHGELNDKAEITDPIWVYVSRLFSRRWFARIWIVQEVALANELVVVCGKHRLSWDIFYAAAQHCLIRNKYDPKIDIATLDTAKNIIDLGQLRKDFTPEPVFKLLNRCYQKEATVPRDRIFALLSMATDKDEAGFGPNYLLDNVTIIQRLSSTFVKQGYAIDLLYRTRPETRTIEEHRIKGEEWVRLPSWMPDLTANHYPSSLSTWSRNYAAGVRKSEEGKLGSRKEPKHLARVQGRELLLRGYVACKIGKQGNCHSMVDDVFSYLEEMFDTIDRLYDRKKTAQEIEEIKWKTAIGDATNLLSEEGDQKSGSAGDEVPSTEHTPEKAKKIQQHMQQRRKRFEAQAAAAYGALVGYLALERPHSSWKRQKLRFEYAMKKGQQQAFPGPAAEDRRLGG
ncbi:heterokaryon incompatibility protein-domain-containing protein [Hypoxylon sp. FL1284]|nr:heterokaryon incompatibility protein-domain-containing protein [Hypoxylon sp. FL1284]